MEYLILLRSHRDNQAPNTFSYHGGTTGSALCTTSSTCNRSDDEKIIRSNNLPARVSYR
jgi:hypothetical protein